MAGMDQVGYKTSGGYLRIQYDRTGNPLYTGVSEIYGFKPEDGGWTWGDRTPGTVHYTPQTWDQYQSMVNQVTPELDAIMAKYGDPHEQLWNWQDYYRAMVGSSLGLGKWGQQGVQLDPLAQLQDQLQAKWDNSFIDKLTDPQDFTGLLKARERGISTKLNQQAAALGVDNAYAGLISQQARARGTVANQAQAAYLPMALQKQQEYRQSSDDLLQAINAAEAQAEQIFATTGV